MSRNDARVSYQTRRETPSPVVSDVVAHYMATSPAATWPSATGLIASILVGLPFREFTALQESLGVSLERLASLLGIAKATLNRRKAAGRLDLEESDRVVRFARLLGKAMDVLEGQENARRWLSSPQTGLGGAVPLEYARTEVGAREVDDLLTRIDHGVYA